MSADLPKWLESRYSLLWEAFGESGFRFADAVKILMDRNKDRWEEIPVFLSELRKAGWLLTESDAKDARQKIYRLVSRKQAIKERLSIDKATLSRGDVEGLLKKAADLIRTRVDYKFILVLLFLKRISDKWELEFEEAHTEALADGLSEEQARQEAKSSAYHTFDLPEEFLWDKLRKDVARLPERFSQALKTVAERNPDLKDVVDSVDFVQFAASSENVEILRQLVELFSERRLHHVSPDILGDAYEWILRYFAPTKAKEGEIYTPREVIQLLIEILDPKPEESVYDPACGSAGMLISAHKHVEEKHGKGEVAKLFLYGQEANPGILALAKMNMYIHDIRDHNLAFGDTFLNPKFKEGGALKTFDVVVANPPWNQKGYPEEVLKKGDFWKQRFVYGLPPGQRADWAWIQHMVASVKKHTGRVGIVIDNGCLSRGEKERAIRLKMLEEDLIECVVLLPEKLFYNTSSAGAILVLNRSKPEQRKRKVLFVNATTECQKHPDVRKLNRLGDTHISRILSAYKSFSEEDEFSHLASLKEIKEKDYSLNVTLYAFPKGEGEKIDVAKEWDELRRVEQELRTFEAKIGRDLGEIVRERIAVSTDRRDSGADPIPEDWESSRVADLFSVETGTTPSTREKAYWQEGTVDWITPTDLSRLDGRIDIKTSERKVTERALKETNLPMMPRGSIIVSTRAPVGYVGVLEKPATFNQGCKGLVPRDLTRISPEFYCYYFSIKTQMLQNLSAGSTFKELSKERLEAVTLPIPPLREQSAIAQILSTTDSAIQKAGEFISKLERIKKGLMEDLLTGRKRVKVAM